MAEEAEPRLKAARARLLLEKPFIGALVMHLPLVAADPAWCASVATDARAFYYNPDYIASLDQGQVQFVLAHEALHCALGHAWRRQHRLKRRWDVACDHAVNLLLRDEGFKPPPGALLNPDFQGLAAEQIYPLIAADTRELPLDLHAFDSAAEGMRSGISRAKRQAAQEGTEGAEDISWDDAGDMRPGQGGVPRRSAAAGSDMPESPRDADSLAGLWRNRLVSAAHMARQAGRLSRTWQRIVDLETQPRVPWRAVLAHHLTRLARDDYSLQRASRRETDAILPGLYSTEFHLLVVLDTSGSIDPHQMRQFVADLDALKGQLRAHITLHACDVELSPNGPWEFPPGRPFALPGDLGGGAGTRFAPVFEWLEKALLRPAAVLYFTDAEGEFPLHPPPIPVIWAVKGRAPVPWGERIPLD